MHPFGVCAIVTVLQFLVQTYLKHILAKLTTQVPPGQSEENRPLTTIPEGPPNSEESTRQLALDQPDANSSFSEEPNSGMAQKRLCFDEEERSPSKQLSDLPSKQSRFRVFP
ncbi:hypothetical protein Ddc_09271 [Ditylenchus destructor]|nr:hypothetical protein Ddc_09271 [Ditylenchus destructor]